MRKMVISSLIISLLIIGVVMVIFKQTKNQPEPKRLVAKFSFGKKGNNLGEFENHEKLIVKENYLFVTDEPTEGDKRIQTLKINPDGSLTALYSFGKKGKELGEFGGIGLPVIKGDYLFVVEIGFKGDLALRGLEVVNNQIHVLKINVDGSLTPKYTFGKKGKRLGQFNTIDSMKIIGDYLYITEANLFKEGGNNRIQSIKINPNGSLSPKFVFGKQGEKLGEFFAPREFVVKNNHIYIIDGANLRIQVLEIKY